MAVLSHTLKEKREELGLTLSEVSQTLDIQERFLKALEEGRFEAIPGDYYFKEFVKKYAGLLKLDGDKLLSDHEKLQRESEEEVLPVKPEMPVVEELEEITDTQQQVKLHKGRVVLALVLSLLFLAGATYWLSGLFRGVTTTQVATATKGTLLPTTSQSESSTSNATTTSETTSTESTTQATTTETTTSMAMTQPSTTRATSSNGLADVYTKSSTIGNVEYGLGRSYAGYTGTYHFVVTASEPTWIRASVSGKVIYEKTIPAGVPINITASQAASHVTFRVGISSAVKITMNDETLVVPKSSRVLNLTVDLTK